MSHKLLKKVMLIGCLLAMSLLASALETKLSGEMWGRWTNETAKFKDTHGEYVNKLSKNYISLERGYFGLETSFTANTKARFTVDMFSSDATHQIPGDVSMPIDTLKSATIDGAGLKLKYGYVEFGNLFPIQDMFLTVGLQKTYFGTIYDWNYDLIEKAPTDLYKVVNSSDYGVTLNGFIPQGWGEYAFGIYNGEGYKKVGASLSDNTDFAYLANLRLMPLPGVTVGGSYMINSVGRDKALSGDVVNSKYEKQNLMDGVGHFAYGPADMWVEYISKAVEYPNATGKDFTAKGLMIMPSLAFNSLIKIPITLIGRYDSWDESDRPTTDSARSLLNTIILGINYGFLPDASDVPQLTLQLDYASKKYDEDKSASSYANGMKDSSQVMLQLKWKFTNLISN